MIVAVLLFSSLPLPVASAEESPSIQLTITPQQTIYDIAGNESRQENVTFSVLGININGSESNTYKIRVAVHEEYQTYGEDALLLLSTNFDLTSSVNLNFSGIGAHEWVNDTNYTILVQLQERPADEDQYETIFNTTFNFSVGEIPEPPNPEPVPLQNLDFDCVLGDDGVWDMMLDDYGNLADHPSVLGIIECSLTNTNSVSILFNLSFQNPSLSDGAGFDMTGFSSFPIRISNNSTEGFNLSLDCGTPSNCEETNGSISIEVEIYSEDVTNWTSNTSQQIIEYTIEENNTTITPGVIKGCMDEIAENFNPNATEDDASCIYPRPPEPSPPTCLLCNFTYNIPDPVSVNTPATFSANITGTEGWFFYGNANISWGFDGTIIYGPDVVHTYTSIPSGGTTDVVVCVVFSDGVERCQTTTITVNQSLTGYIGQSGLLEPMISDNVGGIHFDATALGGLAPYSFEWQFGDGNSSTSSSLVYEFADWGIYDVTLVITDARMDTVNLQTQVEIKNSQDPGDDPTIVDKENVSEPEVTPFGAVATGGGTLLLVMLSRHNSRKQKEKILVAARAKLQNAGMGNEETLGVDDFEGNWD
ncbi:MAG: PKD domain-containing protein [Candidatus Thalassarchaeaceae archaeon]|nr:PKD domain-containing protein [Candidatus Thalassarchaeaceae archaeon]